jgi:hypothetical protein
MQTLMKMTPKGDNLTTYLRVFLVKNKVSLRIVSWRRKSNIDRNALRKSSYNMALHAIQSIIVWSSHSNLVQQMNVSIIIKLPFHTGSGV